MTATDLKTPMSATRIAIWVLRVLMAALFLFAAAMKLTGQSAMVAEFATVGLGQWFRYLTGLMELTGGVMVLLPRRSILGAGLLLLVDAGAFVAQVAVLHMDWIHTVVIGALLVALIVLQRGRGR